MKYIFSLIASAAVAAALPGVKVQMLPAADACPVDLNGDYTAPDLIVPVDRNNPDQAAGTQYVATISNSVDTLFQFNLPSAYSGKTCSLILLYPSTANVQSFSGDGQVHTALMNDQVTTGTTWNSKGTVQTDHGDATIKEGGSYNLATFNCPAGYQLTYDLGSTTGDFNTTWFETNQSPPVGLWVRAC